MRNLYVTLNPKMATKRHYFFRRPRTKKRRILNKWRKRPENWFSEPNVIQTSLLIGSGFRLQDGSKPPPPDEMPVVLEMNPEVWKNCERDMRKNFKQVTVQ